MNLQGQLVNLRALEPEDLDFVHAIENDEDLWELSNTQTPFSRYVIREYLENAHKDIFEVKQLRLMIESKKNDAIGLIDLFDCDFKNSRSGIGIIIKNKNDRNQGLGKEALRLLIDYSFNRLNLHQLYCNVSEENKASLNLFKTQGFKEIGLKKDWNYNMGEFKNEYLLQLIKE